MVHEEQPGKTSILAVLSLLFSAIFTFSYLLALSRLANDMGIISLPSTVKTLASLVDNLGIEAFVFFAIGIFGFFGNITSIFSIMRSKGRLKGKWMAILGLLLLLSCIGMGFFVSSKMIPYSE